MATTSDKFRYSLSRILIEEVIGEHLAKLRDEFIEERNERRRNHRHVKLSNKILPFWGPIETSSLNPQNARMYRIFRNKKQESTGPKKYKPPSFRTVTEELEFLQARVRDYHDDHGLHRVSIDLGDLTHAKSKPVLCVEKAEIVRLLWSTRGSLYQRPPDHNQDQTVVSSQAENESHRIKCGLKPLCFKTDPDEYRPGNRKRLRRHLFRAIIICYYTGSSMDCVLRLHWEKQENGEHSYIDVERGLLYRLGPDASHGKQSGMPVPISERLMVHLRRWARQDAISGHRKIIRSVQSACSSAQPNQAFRNICEDAGLPATVTMSMISNQTGRELMRKNVSIRSAAAFLGLDPDTVERRYGQFRADFHKAARMAMEKRPNSIRSIDAISVQWRNEQN